MCWARGRELCLQGSMTVVREWRALLPVLISTYGCDVNIKQHIKRQCSEIALDPCLPLHRQAPSPVGSLFSQLQFKSSQKRGVILVRSLVPPSNESTLITTSGKKLLFWGQEAFPYELCCATPTLSSSGWVWKENPAGHRCQEGSSPPRISSDWTGNRQIAVWISASKLCLEPTLGSQAPKLSF